MRFAAMLVVVGCANATPAAHTTPPAAQPVPAWRARVPIVTQMTEQQSFALGGVGFTGAMSRGEALAMQLAERPDALAVFDQLATSDNRVARLYAYWALRTLAPARAAVLEIELAADHTIVDTLSGCLMLQAPVSELVIRVQHHRPL